MRSSALLVWLLGVFQVSRGQFSSSVGTDKGLLNRRPVVQSSPCWSGNSDVYDSVEDDVEGRKLLLAAGAAVGGAAVGYHLAMKHQNQQPVINNNIHNEYLPPCIVVQGGGSGGGGGGGGGILGGILGHHPILSNILQGGGGPWSGGGPAGVSANRQGGVNWNRAIRQFSRVVRPITRG